MDFLGGLGHNDKIYCLKYCQASSFSFPGSLIKISRALTGGGCCLESSLLHVLSPFILNTKNLRYCQYCTIFTGSSRSG